MTDLDPLLFENRYKSEAENCGFDIVSKEYIQSVCEPQRNLSGIAAANSDQQSGQPLLDLLPANCLLKMFKNPIIRAQDLLQLAFVCKRLHPIAKEAFSKKIITDQFLEKLELWQSEEFFRIFGEFIKSVQYNSSGLDESDILLCLMTEHCKNVTTFECVVRKFKISHIEIMRDPFVTFLPMLEKLSIYFHGHCDNFPNLFDANMEYRLKELNIYSWSVNLPLMRFPQLENVSINQGNGNMYEFYNLNPGIKSLKLKHVHLQFGISRVLRYLPNLTELELSFVHNIKD